MTDKNNDTEKAAESTNKYASLTSGLLARKGEALPAAAAFTAEAIAQHIPARRLAQEAQRHVGAFSALEHEMRPLQTAMQAQQMAELQEASETGPEFLGLTPVTDEPDTEILGDIETEDTSDKAKTETTPMDFDQIVSEALADVDQRRASAGLRAMKKRLLKGASTGATIESQIVDQPMNGEASEPCAAKKYSEQMKQRVRSQKYDASSSLDPRQFIRLQIAALKLGMMPEDIFGVAVDAYLDQLDEEVFSECNCLKKGLL